MHVVETIEAFREACQTAQRPLGLVPTMGGLHEGHRALLRQARLENDALSVSLFLNPRQFDSERDFKDYPRTLKSDLTMMEEEGADLVFLPSVKQMYPHGFETSIDVGSIGKRLEGCHRPGHFLSVSTVVCKLFCIARPNRAYFGQKDVQQCLVINRLNADLNLGAEIVVVPTVRDKNGLALSSRNTYLSVRERKAATILYSSLCMAQNIWEEGGRDTERVQQHLRAFIEKEVLARVEYISIVDAETLEGLPQMDRPVLISLAIHVGKTRLIDSIFLG